MVAVAVVVVVVTTAVVVTVQAGGGQAPRGMNRLKEESAKTVSMPPGWEGEWRVRLRLTMHRSAA